MKIDLPEGEEHFLFIDEMAERILSRYVPAREMRGLPVCKSKTFICSVIGIVIDRQLREFGICGENEK